MTTPLDFIRAIFLFYHRMTIYQLIWQYGAPIGIMHGKKNLLMYRILNPCYTGDTTMLFIY